MVCGFVLFRYLPLQRKTKFLRQAYAAQMLAISKASAESQQIPTIREQLLQLQTAVGNYERQIPSQRELGEFLQRIANLMNEHNLQGQLIQPGKEIKAGELNCIPVNMQCKGRLSQIFEFYRRVQGLDRLVRIEHVKLVNDGDFGGEVIMQINAVIYYRAEVGQG
jgi:Tfp pilus assembly protein PilO